MTCTKILPDSTLEEQYTFPVINLLDPISYYNTTQLRTVNILNNVILKKYDLTKYPNLLERKNQGTITDTEFADFLLDSGLSLQFVQETFINDFPVEIDYSVIENIVKQIDNDEKKTKIGHSNPENLDTFLQLQDNYYGNSLLSNNSNICGALSNPFSGIVEVLATARDLAAGVKDYAADISKIIHDIKYLSLSSIIKDLTSKLLSFQTQLLNFVDSFATQQLTKIIAIQDTVTKMFESFASIPFATYKHYHKKIRDTKKLFSEENLTEIKNSLTKLFTMNIKQFEDKLPDALNFLLIVTCGLFSDIENIMKSPVDTLRNSISLFNTSHKVISGHSTNIRNSIKQIGGSRIDPTTRQSEKSTAISNWNRSRPSNNIPSDVTANERSLLDKIDANGLSGYFSFNSNVQNMGTRATERFESNKSNATFQKLYDPDENFHYNLGSNGGVVDAGWALVNLGVWVRLIRTIDGVRNAGHSLSSVTIISAFRSAFYNRIIAGGATNSYHMRGEALDIAFGMAKTTGEEFIRQASINGFGGISYYPSSTFTHFDVGPVRTWNANGKYTSIINKHLRGGI